MSQLLLEDPRAIDAVVLKDAGHFYQVGADDVERIEVYAENGEMAPVPWLAIISYGQVSVRIPARAVLEIHYKVVRR